MRYRLKVALSEWWEWPFSSFGCLRDYESQWSMALLLPTEFQRSQVVSELFPEPRALQSKLDRRLQKAQLISCIVAPAFKNIAIDGFPFEHSADCVRQLDFFPRALKSDRQV